MAVIRLLWLGPLAIEDDGRPLRLEMRKTLALLAYLSLSPQSPTRETLAAMFWPEFDQQHALANLRRHEHLRGPWIMLDSLLRKESHHDQHL